MPCHLCGARGGFANLLSIRSAPHREFFVDLRLKWAAMTTFDATGERVALRRPAAADTEEFTALMRDSREFHFPWIDPPRTAEQYEAYLRSRQAPGDDGFLICARQTNAIVGFINLNSIVRRSFQSAYVGYTIGARYA